MRRMSETDRKTPEMLTTRAKREPLSTRVKETTKEILDAAAEKADTSLSDLTAAILDDYAEWYERSGNKDKRKK